METIITVWSNGCFTYQFDGNKTSKAEKIPFSKVCEMLKDKEFKTELIYSDGLQEYYFFHSFESK